MTLDLSCSICGKPALGVASSPFIPMSHAYCKTCLEENAEPHYDLDYLIEEMPNWKDMDIHQAFNEYVFTVKTFWNGSYISFEDYFNLKKKEDEQYIQS